MSGISCQVQHVCNYTDVYKNDRITDEMDLMRATATAAEIARLTLKAGDVILTKDSETPDDIGVPAWVPEDLPGVVCAYHLGLLRPVPDRVLGEADASGKKRKKRKQIFPRFHQLRTVRSLLRRAHTDGVGKRYLIQHSAGSGKSNTIAWLAHQLVELRRKDDPMTAQFDSIIVITDRRALDTQIARTIKGYDHVAAIFGHSDNAQELREYLRRGKKIIVTTVQKFPFILDELGDLSGKSFALLIDEAHSSQGGKTTARMHEALSAIIKTFNDLFGNIEWKDEDKIRKVIAEEIPARVAQDKAYQNAQANSDKQNAKLEHDKALNRVVLELLSDHTELFKQFSDNPNFKRWLTDMVFDATYQSQPKATAQPSAGF